MRYLLLVLCLLAAAVMAAQTSGSNVKKLSADELKQVLEKNKEVFLLDVREPKELEELGAIKGYVNIPVGQLESRLAEIPKSQPVAVYCRIGGRAGRAGELLGKNGYQVLGAAGIVEWREKNYPVVYPNAEKK